MKRTAIRFVSSLTILLPLAAGLAGRAQGGPMNPLDFTSLGAFPTASGTYTFDTNGPTPTLTGPGGSVVETGVYSNGIAVFDFNSINMIDSQTFLGGSWGAPIALLSRTDASIAGFIDVSAVPNPTTSGPNAGGPGAGGPGTGGDGTMGTFVVGGGRTNFFSGGGGGGFGGAGGAGEGRTDIPGGAGGAAYGNPAIQLQGGSSGGNSGSFRGTVLGYGGGGGGAIELGAVGRMSISGSIYANGDDTEAGGGGIPYASGGGSGGAILLHAQSVDLSGWLLALGGTGGPDFVGGGPGEDEYGSGGGGGGGRITILGPFSLSSVSGSPPIIDVSGGLGNVNGADGVVTINGTIVPEPASLVLMGTGMLALLGIRRRHRRVAA